MLSPAAQQRKIADKVQSVQAATSVTPPAATAPATTVAPDDRIPSVSVPVEHNVWALRFKMDFDRMNHIKSRTRRNLAKRETLVSLQDWLNTVMQSGDDEPDTEWQFVWLLVWHLDVCDWQRGLTLARYALNAGFSAPRDFNRNLAELVCEDIADGILHAGTCSSHLNLLDELAALVEDYDITDQISAKLFKARGLARIPLDLVTARDYLQQALELDANAGVKKHLNNLKLLLSEKPKTSRAAPVDLTAFNLSARAAAKMANMHVSTLLRHAKAQPQLLPCVAIPVGNRTFYRFNQKQVKAYLTQHMVKTNDTNS